MLRKTIILLFAALLITVLAIQNAQTIHVKLFFWQFENIPLAILVIGCIFAGSIFVATWGTFKSITTRRELKQLKEELEEVSTKYNELLIETEETVEEEEEEHPEGAEIKKSDNIRFFND